MELKNIDVVSKESTNIIYKKGLVIAGPCSCLLYTSDAADERSSVDLGGRRIIKKKKKQNNKKKKKTHTTHTQHNTNTRSLTQITRQYTHTTISSTNH